MKPFLALLLCIAGQALAAVELDDFAVLVAGTKNMGTGIPISEDRIATACHTIAQSRTVMVFDRTGRFIGRTWYAWADPERDICILQLDRGHGMAFPAIERSKASRNGEAIHMVGFSGGTLSAHDGRVIGTDSAGVIETDVLVTNGASGSGLFNPDRRLAGMVLFIQTDANGRRRGSFAAPAKWLIDDARFTAMPVSMLHEGREFWRGTTYGTIARGAVIPDASRLSRCVFW